MNENGHSATLQASHPGNTNRLAHGAYSSSAELTPRAAEVADALMSLPHVAALDRLAAEEIGRLVALLERVDADLAERGLTRRNGEARNLLDLHGRLSGRLERWQREFGTTPASRADFGATLARGARRRAGARRGGRVTDDRRATLEAIAYGGDPDLRPGDPFARPGAARRGTRRSAVVRRRGRRHPRRRASTGSWTPARVQHGARRGRPRQRLAESYPTLVKVFERTVERRARGLADEDRTWPSCA